MDRLTELAMLVAENERRDKGSVYRYLYPEKDITLTAGTFPSTHKLFEGAETIHNRHKYPKALEFWAKGDDYPFRTLMSGNRVGKTTLGAFEVVLHLTGLYPTWWEGKRFTTCNDWWCCGDTQETVIEVLQPLFLGKVGQFGTGLIPMDHIDFDTLKSAQKEKTGVGSIRVKHINGTYSSLTFKSYEQGRKSFQGTAKSIFLDEEPPQEVFGECLMRTMTGGNIMIATYTPLSGETDLIKSMFDDGDYMKEGDLGNGRYLVRIGMDDVPHLSPDRIQDILSAFPEYQRKARRLGIPTLGEGAIFPYDKDRFVIDPIAIPDHFAKGYGFDVGNRTAAVWLAHDRDANIYYAYSDYYEENSLPAVHISAIKARGLWLKGAIDTASHAANPSDQQRLFEVYTNDGLNIENAEKSVESGIFLMQTLLNEGRLKIFSTCTKLISQMLTYRRDKAGKVVKKSDDTIDALRYGLMTKNILRTKAEYDLQNAPIEIDYTQGVGYNHSADGWMYS
jgi:phage terminase large subunit-like protein